LMPWFEEERLQDMKQVDAQGIMFKDKRKGGSYAGTKVGRTSLRILLQN
jgi:hypothetical protein